MSERGSGTGGTGATGPLPSWWGALHGEVGGFTPESPGTRIGGYTLVSVLGEGGFGRVWLAEQHEPIARTVAMKIIKPGMDSAAVVLRFEQERQALAMMDHPNVARVFDAGTTPLGRPYFVMEYVRGRAITAYCDENRLTIRERLGLFAQVCEAVQHAHMKGIIHRDLKPSNILVEEVDGKPLPKVIDFGVAKAIEQSLTTQTLFTEAGVLIGTPEYMSPEQAAGMADIDTRTDVYSLGVVLYELLTGQLPFDSAELRSKGYAEIQRIIREVDPPRPATRLARAAEASGTGVAAEQRRTHTAGLTRELRRELEWVPLKAMRKEREGRYATALEMGEDVRRYLDGRALLAGPESRVYRVRKFVRRNRALVTGAALIVLTLVLGVAGTTSQWLEAKKQTGLERAARIAASRRQNQAERTTQFLTGMIASADPDKTHGREVTVREVVDAAAEKIKSELGDEPEVRSEVLRVVGRTYLSLGLRQQALKRLTEALEVGKPAWGAQSEFAADTLEQLAQSTVDSNTDLAAMMKAETYLSESYEIRRAMLGDSAPRTAKAASDLGHLRGMLGKPMDHEKSFYVGMRILPEYKGKTDEQLHAELLERVRKIDELWLSGDKEGAIALNRAGFESMRKVPFLGKETAGTMAVMAVVVGRRGFKGAACAGAEAAVRLALEGGEDTIEVFQTCGQAGNAMYDCGNYEMGVEYTLRALKVIRRLVHEDSTDLWIALGNAAMCLDMAGRSEEAETLFTEALAKERLANQAARLNLRFSHARCLFHLGRFDEAETEGLETYAKLEERPAMQGGVLEGLADILTKIYESRGDTVNAEQWRVKSKPKKSAPAGEWKSP